MNLGFENRRQAITAGILAPFALGAIIYLVMQLLPSSSSAPAPAAAPVVVKTAESSTAQHHDERAFANSEVAPVSSTLDPTLHPEIMFAAEHLEYTGNGRNIFSMSSAPAVAAVNIPKPIAPPRPVSAAPVYTGPPPPPPIPFKLFGVETKSNGTRQVFLLHGEDVFMAQEGDIVMRQYKVTRITANSVEMEDLPNNNKQVLPLQK